MGYKNYMIQHELSNHGNAGRIKTEFVATPTEVSETIRRYIDSSEGTLIEVRKLPSISPSVAR